MVLPSLNARKGSSKLPPVASAPPIGGRNPSKPNPSRVTVNEQLALLPHSSVAVQVTTVLPIGNTEPEAGTAVTVALPQLSLMLGAGKTTGNGSTLQGIIISS